MFRAAFCPSSGALFELQLQPPVPVHISTLASIREPEAAAAVQKVLLLMGRMLPETC
jgi:hypothetical protein